MRRHWYASVKLIFAGVIVVSMVFVMFLSRSTVVGQGKADRNDSVLKNAQELIDKGRQTFRYDTFGDEAPRTTPVTRALAGG